MCLEDLEKIEGNLKELIENNLDFATKDSSSDQIDLIYNSFKDSIELTINAMKELKMEELYKSLEKVRYNIAEWIKDLNELLSIENFEKNKQKIVVYCDENKNNKRELNIEEFKILFSKQQGNW